MKKLIVPILVVALLLLGVGSASADGEYTRIIIPKIDLSAAIQPLGQMSDGSWPEPNHFTAWCLDPESYPGQDCLQAIYLHRGNLGSELELLKRGDLVYLDAGGFKHGPLQIRLQLRVTKTDIIPEDKEDSVLGVVGGDVFALVTCHPANDSEAPERLVVWLEVDRGPQWVYVDWGDTLFLIGQRYGVPVEVIARANGIADPNFVRAGTWLKIPRK